MRDLSLLRWKRENRRRVWVVPAASRSAQPRGQECYGWRIILFHSEWHTKYRHARLANARSGRYQKVAASQIVFIRHWFGLTRGEWPYWRDACVGPPLPV